MSEEGKVKVLHPDKPRTLQAEQTAKSDAAADEPLIVESVPEIIAARKPLATLGIALGSEWDAIVKHLNK